MLNPALYSKEYLRERGQRWFKLSGAMHKMIKSHMSYADYRRLAEQHPVPHQIAKDVIRTMPEVYVDQPKTQQFLLGALESTGRTVEDSRAELERVLSTFVMALDYPGYSQGMNFVVYFLLMFLDEEQAFWMLVTLVQDLKVPDFYESVQCTGLLVDSSILTDLCLERLKGLGHAVGEQTIQLLVQLVTPKCLISLSLSLLPIEISIYVMDIYFSSPSFIQNAPKSAVLPHLASTLSAQQQQQQQQHQPSTPAAQPLRQQLGEAEQKEVSAQRAADEPSFAKPLPPSFDVHHADAILFRLVLAILDVYYLREIRKLTTAQIASIDRLRYPQLIRDAKFLHTAMQRGRTEAQAKSDLAQWHLSLRAAARGEGSSSGRANRGTCSFFGEEESLPGSQSNTPQATTPRTIAKKKSQVVPEETLNSGSTFSIPKINILTPPSSSAAGGVSHVYAPSDIESLALESSRLMAALGLSQSPLPLSFGASEGSSEDPAYTDALALVLCDAYDDPTKLQLDVIAEGDPSVAPLLQLLQDADSTATTQDHDETTADASKPVMDNSDPVPGEDNSSIDAKDEIQSTTPTSSQLQKRLLKRTNSIADGRGVPDVARVWLGIAAVLEQTPPELVLNRILFDPRVIISNKQLDILRAQKRQLTLHSLRSKSKVLQPLRALAPEVLLDLAAMFRMKKVYHPHPLSALEALREVADHVYAKQVRQAATPTSLTSTVSDEPVPRPRSLRTDDDDNDTETDTRDTSDTVEGTNRALAKPRVLKSDPTASRRPQLNSIPEYYFSAFNTATVLADTSQSNESVPVGTPKSDQMKTKVTVVSKKELEMYHHLSFEGVKDFTVSPRELFALLRSIGVSESLLPPPDLDLFLAPAAIRSPSMESLPEDGASVTSSGGDSPPAFNPLLEGPLPAQNAGSSRSSPNASPRLEPAGRGPRGIRPGALSAFERLFILCDQAQRGIVDLRDIIMLLAMQIARTPEHHLEPSERLWFCFAVNDADSDGMLTHKEAKHLIVFLQNVALGQPLPDRTTPNYPPSKRLTSALGDEVKGNDETSQLEQSPEEHEEGVLRFDECSELVMSEPFLSSALGLRIADFESPQSASLLDRQRAQSMEDTFGCSGCGLGDDACTIA